MKDRHSRLGIASFVISLVTIVGYVILFIIIGSITRSLLKENGELITHSSKVLIFLGSSVLVLAFFNIIGVVMGIIGLTSQKQHKAFDMIGTIINAVIILVFMLFIAFIVVKSRFS